MGRVVPSPLDPLSFPTEPDLTADAIPEEHPLEDSGIGAHYEIRAGRIDIRWTNLNDGESALALKTAGSEGWNIYYGGHFRDHAQVSLGEFELTGKETLVGAFSKRVDRRFAEQYPEFTIDLATLEFPEPPVLGDPSNRLSYAFSSDFPPEAESQYRELLKRVFPILYGHLGPPAETFNVYIENLGEYSDSFVVVDGGRTFLTDTSFIPRLITHEYVRSYPNDPASIQLLEEKPYQYWSSKTVNYDAIKNLRWTGAGDFWNPPSGAANRYSIAATTVQMLIRENPNFMREFLSLYYETIREDTDWRPNRNDLVAMWETLVPELSGYPLVEYLDTLPVFIRDHGRR